jgi:hypothetical protein
VLAVWRFFLLVCPILRALGRHDWCMRYQTCTCDHYLGNATYDKSCFILYYGHICPLARHNPQPRYLMIIVQGVFIESSCNYVYGELSFLTTAYRGIHSMDTGEGIDTLKFFFSSDLFDVL